MHGFASSGDSKTTTETYQPPPTQTGSGGGGLLPPNNPPTTYYGGEDADKDGGRKDKGEKAGGEARSRPTGKFGEIWSVEHDGTKVFREGQHDAQGRVRVYKYYNHNYVKRGYVVTDLAHPDGVRVHWEKGYQLRNQFHAEIKALAGSVNPQQDIKPSLNQNPRPLPTKWPNYPAVQRQGKLPRNRSLVPIQSEEVNRRPIEERPELKDRMRDTDITRYKRLRGDTIPTSENHPTGRDYVPHSDYVEKDVAPESRTEDVKTSKQSSRVLLESITVATPTSQAERTELFGSRANGIPEKIEVFFQGRHDRYGRNLVFRPLTYTGQVSLDRVMTGSLNADGTIEWHRHQNISYEQLVTELEKVDLNKRNDLSSQQKEAFRRALQDMRFFRSSIYVAHESNKPPSARPRQIHEYPHFRENKEVKSNGPVPRDRSLVPYRTDEGSREGRTIEERLRDTDTTRYQRLRGDTIPPIKEGQTGRDYVSQRDYIDYRPSKVGEKLGWTARKSQDLGEQLRRFAKGEDLLKELKDASVRPSAPDQKQSDLIIEETVKDSKRPLGQRVKESTTSFSFAAFAFYAALGFVAGYTLLTNYSNNPMAMDEYVKHLKDPVGYLALAGFMAAAGVFYKRLGGPGEGKTFIRQLPIFVGAILVGTLAATVISQIGNDKDFLACAGFAGFKQTGEFKRDQRACDQLWDKVFTNPEWTNGVYEIAAKMVPAGANLLVAGSIFFGGLWTAQLLYGKFKTAKNITVSTIPRLGLIGTLAMGTFVMISFLGAFELTDQILQTEKRLSQYNTAEWSFWSDHYGSTIKEAELLLFTEWKKIKDMGWLVPQPKIKTIAERAAQSPFVDDTLPHPAITLLPNIIDRYSKLMASWRKVQMSEPLMAYKQWQNKVEAFDKVHQASYEYYGQVLHLIENAPDKMVPASLRITQDRSVLSKFFNSFDQTWKHVSTPFTEDFLLTSMACGPEVENVVDRGFWGKVQDYAIGSSGPKQMIDSTSGHAAQFFPPRITTPLAGTSDSICATGSSLLDSAVGLVAGPSVMPDKFTVEQNGKTYNGLHEYIRENIRPSVTSEGLSKWWAKNVLPEAKALRDNLDKDFKKMLDDSFKTALTRRDYYEGWCSPAPVSGTGLEKYATRLTSARREGCAPENLHRLSLGIMNSLRDEVRLYLALLVDLYISNSGRLNGQTGVNSVAVQETLTLAKAKAVLESVESIIEVSTHTNASTRPDTQAIADQSDKAFRELQEVINNGHDVIKAQGRIPFQLVWANHLLGLIKALTDQSKDYYNVVTLMEAPPPTAPQ